VTRTTTSRVAAVRARAAAEDERRRTPRALRPRAVWKSRKRPRPLARSGKRGRSRSRPRLSSSPVATRLWDGRGRNGVPVDGTAGARAPRNPRRGRARPRRVLRNRVPRSGVRGPPRRIPRLRTRSRIEGATSSRSPSPVTSRPRNPLPSPLRRPHRSPNRSRWSDPRVIRGVRDAADASARAVAARRDQAENSSKSVGGALSSAAPLSLSARTAASIATESPLRSMCSSASRYPFARSRCGSRASSAWNPGP